MSGLVMVGIDLHEAQRAQDALALGGTLSEALDAVLQAVYVFEPAGDADAERRAHERAMVELLERTEISGAATAFAGRSPAPVLHYLAGRERPSCVVVGSGHGGRTGYTWLGAVGEGLLHGCTAPVVVAPKGYVTPPDGIARVGVAYAGTPESDVAVDRAAELASATGARLTVVTATEPGAGPDVARERLVGALGMAGPRVEGMIADGDAVEALAEAAAGLDLLVAGSRSYGPLRAVVLGAVTRRLLHTAPCPVVLVPRLPDAAHGGALVGGMDVAVGS